ncbi:M6PR isoform 2, partial [Pan troglodytes]
ILLVTFASLVAVYVVGGFLYQRLVVGAKGMEQFPHLAFWQDLGNLVAKGNGSRSGTSRALLSSALGVECCCTCPFCWLREVSSCPHFCGERFLIL